MKLNKLKFGLFCLFIISYSPLFSQSKKIMKLMNEAKKEIMDSNYLGAINQLNQVLEKDDINTDALFLRGICFDSLNKYNEATRDYSQVIAFSSNSEAYRNRAYIRFKNGDYNKAIFDYEKFIDLNSQDADAYYFLASSYFYTNNLSKALTYYSNAINIDTSHADVYADRGIVKYKLEDFIGAIADYDKAILIIPNKSYLINRANIKTNIMDYEGAITDLTKAIEFESMDNDSLAYYNRGSVKLLIKDYLGSIEDLNTAIVLNPNNSDFYSQRGLVKYSSMDFIGAINDYSKSILINPYHFRSYNNRGNTYFELKDNNAACSDWQFALQIILKNSKFQTYKTLESEIFFSTELLKKQIKERCE